VKIDINHDILANYRPNQKKILKKVKIHWEKRTKKRYDE